MRRLLFPLAALTSLQVSAQTLNIPPIQFGGFLDTYYSFDSNTPKDHEREYTTQPVRHNEFNVNLAYIEAMIKQENTRGRLALQFGQSVTKNTVGEPQDGKTSGSSDSKIFQEAYLGKKLSEKTWIEMGIFLGNIGAESWISKDNWTYTRALNLDYVPYYSAGVRIDHTIDSKQSAQLQLLNGWGNMSENNQGKAIGAQYKNLLNDSLTFTYNNFFGDEEVTSTKPRFRSYHNFILKWLHSDRWQYLFAFDVGHQSQKENDGVDGWFTTTATIRRVLSATEAIALRAEYYSDPHEANISTATPKGFQVAGLSMNYDQNWDKNFLWRSEIRGFYSEDKIYPQGRNGKNRLDGFFVTSISAWF